MANETTKYSGHGSQCHHTIRNSGTGTHAACKPELVIHQPRSHSSQLCEQKGRALVGEKRAHRVGRALIRSHQRHKQVDNAVSLCEIEIGCKE